MPMCDWSSDVCSSDLGTGSRPEHKTKPYCHRAATQPTAPTQQFWEAFENIPLPLQHFPSGSLILRPQGRILHLCVLTEHFTLPAGHRERGRSQGGSCTASMGFLAKGRGNPRNPNSYQFSLSHVDSSSSLNLDNQCPPITIAANTCSDFPVCKSSYLNQTGIVWKRKITGQCHS